MIVDVDKKTKVDIDVDVSVDITHYENEIIADSIKLDKENRFLYLDIYINNKKYRKVLEISRKYIKHLFALNKVN